MPDGRVVADAFLTRVGVFKYVRPDGSIIRELRDPKHVFDRRSMDSFANLPLTNNHPDVGLLDTKTAKAYAVGATGDAIVRDGDYMRGKIVAWDGETIDDMDAGKVQVSNGYTCDLVKTPGVHPQYGAYDAIQTNILGNHVAIVDAGRAGPMVRVRMDAASCMMQQEGDPMTPNPMPDPNATDEMDDGLTAEQRNALGAESFAVPSRRALPIEDPKHVRAAMARFAVEQFQSASEKRSAYEKIVARAKKLGVDPAGFVAKYSSKLDDAASGLPTSVSRATIRNMDEAAIRAMNQKAAELDAEVKRLDAEVTKQTARADAAEAERDISTKKCDALEATRFDEKSVLETAAVKRANDRADELQKKLDAHDAKFDAAVQSRSQLLARASAVLGGNAPIADRSERSIMVEVIKRLDSTEDVSDKRSDAALEAVFNVLYKNFVEGAESTARAAEVLTSHVPAARRRDISPVAPSTPPKRSRRDQWRDPLPSSMLRK